MYLLVTCFFLPMISMTVVVKIHRSSVYNATSTCAFLRNTTWSTDTSIESCIWECVYEEKCQTAVYFRSERVCSMFSESCKLENIHSSGMIQGNVICYRNNPGKYFFLVIILSNIFPLEFLITCPSTAILSQTETTVQSINDNFFRQKE